MNHTHVQTVRRIGQLCGKLEHVTDPADALALTREIRGLVAQIPDQTQIRQHILRAAQRALGRCRDIESAKRNFRESAKVAYL